jgi:micrococcal nuclease
MRRKSVSVISLIVVLIALASYYFPSTGNASASKYNYPIESSVVTKVIDGDTVVIGGGQRIRLLNMDTREKGENCYKEAKARMEELVLLKNITLERDKEDKDRYDRLLRYIFVDGKNINLQMVKDGLAIVYIYEPNVKYRAAFEAAEKTARTEGGCVWTKMP